MVRNIENREEVTYENFGVVLHLGCRWCHCVASEPLVPRTQKMGAKMNIRDRAQSDVKSLSQLENPKCFPRQTIQSTPLFRPLLWQPYGFK